MHDITEHAAVSFVATPRHPVEIIQRLRWIERWVREAGRAYQDGYACIDTLDQLVDLRRELDDIGRLVLEDHVVACREPVIHSSQTEAGACRLLLAISRSDGAPGRPRTRAEI